MSSDFMHFVIAAAPPPARPGSEVWADGAARWSRAVGPMVRDAIRDKAPIGQGQKNKRLKDSIEYHSTTAVGSLLLVFGSRLPQAKWVIEGTRPHLIVPTKKRTLYFLTDAGDKVFAARVNHPGTRANAFPRRAVVPRLPQIRESFSTVMREAMGGAP